MRRPMISTGFPFQYKRPSVSMPRPSASDIPIGRNLLATSTCRSFEEVPVAAPLRAPRFAERCAPHLSPNYFPFAFSPSSTKAIRKALSNPSIFYPHQIACQFGIVVRQSAAFLPLIACPLPTVDLCCFCACLHSIACLRRSPVSPLVAANRHRSRTEYRCARAKAPPKGMDFIASSLSARAALRFALKLDVALLGDRSLLDSDHLPLHLGQLSGRLLVTADEECRRPEDYDGRRSRQSIICALLVLCTGQSRRPGRNRLRLVR
jgi:hypothetical protein